VKRVLVISAAAILSIMLASATSAGRSTRPNGLIGFDRADPASTEGDTFVFTANPDGSRARRLIKSHTCCPGWSHDGRRLAIPASISGDRIGTATVNADGTGYKLLRINDRTLNAGCLLWSRNDRTLACESWDETRAGRNGIYLLPSASGGTPKRLTSNRVGGNDLPGSYSPDGKRLVFTRFNKNEISLGLFIVNVNGTGLRRITPRGTIIQAGNSGDWSPTGNQILFSRHATSSVGSIWVINADGSGLREIKVSGRDCGGSTGCHQPRWSPDGTSIVFASNSGDRSDIYTANSDGTGLKRITSGGRDDDPSWGSHAAR
jgi:Tol biopolymer transport system component